MATTRYGANVRFPPIADIGDANHGGLMDDAPVDVVPVYGFGWVAVGESCVRDTPAPFQVRLKQHPDSSWTGTVETSGHEFEGLTVRLSQRLERWEGTVNVEVGKAADGYAEVSDYRQLNGRG